MHAETVVVRVGTNEKLLLTIRLKKSEETESVGAVVAKLLSLAASVDKVLGSRVKEEITEELLAIPDVLIVSLLLRLELIVVV